MLEESVLVYMDVAILSGFWDVKFNIKKPSIFESVYK